MRGRAGASSNWRDAATVFICQVGLEDGGVRTAACQIFCPQTCDLVPRNRIVVCTRLSLKSSIGDNQTTQILNIQCARKHGTEFPSASVRTRNTEHSFFLNVVVLCCALPTSEMHASREFRPRTRFSHKGKTYDSPPRRL